MELNAQYAGRSYGMSEPPSLIYRFGAFRLDPAKRLLTFNRQTILIAPKPFDTLLALVERNGLVVSKDELIKLICADTYVEEANVSQNIFLLRKLLGRDNAGHRYIETIPRQGYRFIGKVREEQHRGIDVEVKTGRDHTSSNGRKTDNVQHKFLTSLAVLPLINASADPATEHLSDGITEAIINNLSQAWHLRIISRTTAFRYKGQEISIATVGHETRVDNVLTGRVFVQGDEINVQIDLNSVDDESQFWGRQYDFSVTNESTAQREIAKDVLAQLELRLKWLQAAHAERSDSLIGIQDEPGLDSLHSSRNWCSNSDSSLMAHQ
jgi:TolB-like protein